jgi:hypothetical protein
VNEETKEVKVIKSELERNSGGKDAKAKNA